MTRLLYFLILFCALLPANGQGQGFLHARDTTIVDGSGLPRLQVIAHQTEIDWPTLVKRLQDAISGSGPEIH